MGVGAAAGALLFLAVYMTGLYATTPGPQQLRVAQTATPSVVISADGQTLVTFRRVQQEQVPLERVAPAVTQALIATEDHRFNQHRGVDVRRTLSALLHTLVGRTQGGSTLTQQLARNVFPEEIGRARTVERKLKEMMTALRIERACSKREILEAYLNTAPFLYNVVGIEMAARTYFDKRAAELDTLESATLVGMLKGTVYYNPVRYPERAQKRRNIVLAQMAKRGHLSAERYQELAEQPLRLRFKRPVDDPGPTPHFTAQVRKWLIQWADEHNRDLYADGLVVETTLDMKLQEVARRAVAHQGAALQNVADVEWAQAANPLANSPQTYATRRSKVQPFRHFWAQRPDLLNAFVRESARYRKLREAGASDASALQQLMRDASFMAMLREQKTRLEAGFAAIDPRTGEVKAWVGSRDFERDQFDHVAQAQRQPGSTFKPLVYAAALEAGISPDQSYVDAPFHVPLSDGTVWSPTDMSGHTGAVMTLRDGLVMSKNTITAQVGQEVGAQSIVRVAQAAGVRQSQLQPVPSLALGTSPVTLLEMLSAYATIAGLGEHRSPLMVRRIRDREGRVLAEFDSAPQQAFSSESARDLIDMMRGVVTHGTGTLIKTRFDIAADVAGKTGTTQYNADGWFILMHPHLVAGAWVGFNDQRVTMRSDYWGQGGHNAIWLVGDFFREVLKKELLDKKATFPPPWHEAVKPAYPAGTAPFNEADLSADPPAAGGLPASEEPNGGIVIERREDGSVAMGDPAGVEALRRQRVAPQDEGAVHP